MSDPFPSSFDSQTDETPLPGRSKKLSSNEQWVFGSIFAALLLVGFAFGVVTGASRPKPVEVADKKDKEPERVAAAPKPAGPQPPKPKEPTPEPKLKETDPDSKTGTPKAKDSGSEPMKNSEPSTDPKTEPKTDPKTKESTPDPKTVAKTDPKTNPAPKGTEPKKFEGTPVAFEKVKPILISYCVECHSSVKPRKKVDLSSLAAIMKGGSDGPTVVPGSPEKSSLYTTMISDDASTVMPPPDKTKRPTPAEIKLIHDWIASGAKPRRVVRRRR